MVESINLKKIKTEKGSNKRDVMEKNGRSYSFELDQGRHLWEGNFWAETERRQSCWPSTNLGAEHSRQKQNKKQGGGDKYGEFKGKEKSLTALGFCSNAILGRGCPWLPYFKL